MKHLLTLTITAITFAAFAGNVLAEDCGSCPAGGKKDKAKDKDKTEESTQS